MAAVTGIVGSSTCSCRREIMPWRIFWLLGCRPLKIKYGKACEYEDCKPVKDRFHGALWFVAVNRTGVSAIPG